MAPSVDAAILPLRTEPAIAMAGLSRAFDGELAVDSLSLTVERGEILGFLGPNGAGKTTTLRMLATALAPASGDATILGHSVREEPVAVRRLIGVMTERPGLYDRLSVDTNLRLWAEAHELDDPDAAIGRALDLVGLADRRHERVSRLSKGLKQRAALARAIVHDPPVLLLDEPSSGLDPEASVQVEAMIRHLVEGGTAVFLNTHRLAEAQRLCDRVAVLRTRLLAAGTPSELRQRICGDRVRVRLAEPLDPEALALIHEAGATNLRVDPHGFECSLADVGRDTPELVAAVVDAGGRVLEVAPSGDLERAYLELVGEAEVSAAAPFGADSDEVEDVRAA